MNINQIKISLQELESNLANHTIATVLENSGFDVEVLEEAIQGYFKNIDKITNTDLLNALGKKIQELISYSNQQFFHNYLHQFINGANFLIKNAPPNQKLITNNISENISSDEVSEKEFSKRYEKLIKALNFEGEESNLILETPTEKKPFKVYKTKTNSLAVYAASSEKAMTIAADRLLEVAFKRKEPTYASYETVLISKIMDNSIFDFLNESKHNDRLKILQNNIDKNANELYILKNDLAKVQQNEHEISNAKEQLLKILQESKNAKSEYISAKEAAVNDAKLKSSVEYWDEKSIKHKNQFYLYGGIAILLIVSLIFLLVYTYNHINDFVDIGSINNIVKASVDSNSSTAILADHVQKTPFEYIHFIGLYILLIFASSSAVWIIRLIVKIALSNLHLSEDAHERVVMIKTYLSFIQEGHGLQENDKQLIMSSIFRPSSIGIIQDESSITVADIITSIKK